MRARNLTKRNATHLLLQRLVVRGRVHDHAEQALLVHVQQRLRARRLNRRLASEQVLDQELLPAAAHCAHLARTISNGGLDELRMRRMAGSLVAQSGSANANRSAVDTARSAEHSSSQRWQPGGLCRNTFECKAVRMRRSVSVNYAPQIAVCTKHLAASRENEMTGQNEKSGVKEALPLLSYDGAPVLIVRLHE